MNVGVLLVTMMLGASSDPRLLEAERLAAHGEVDSAVAAYSAVADELLASGAQTSADIHYNLGTLALGQGDDGTAVLHLLAAQRRAPFDDDIRHNVTIAMQRRADQVDDARGTSVLRRLPRGVVAGCAGAVLALLGINLLILGVRGASTSQASPTTPTAPTTPRRLVLPLSLVAVVAVSLWVAHAVADTAEIVVVMQDTMALPQPDASADGFEVHPGLTGDVVAEEKGFARVRLENGVDVWIARSAIRRVP
jgi:hypothetical protein